MSDTTYAVLDFETTGLIPSSDDVIEIAVLKLDADFNLIASYQTLVKLDQRLEVPEFVRGLTGITTEQTQKGMPVSIAMGNLHDFIKGCVIVAQHASFDLAFLKAKMSYEPTQYICTRSLSHLLEPLESASLKPTCERLGIELSGAHRAMADVTATAELLRFRALEFGGNPPVNTLVVGEDRPLSFIPRATEKILLKGGGLLFEKK